VRVPDPAVLVPTRRSLHAVAEWVVAPARLAVDGHLGLTVMPGGFGAPAADVRVDGTALVVGDRRRPLTTLGQAAALAGVPPGRASDAYPTVTAWDAEAPLILDEASAQLLADWWALGASALEEVGAKAVTLWPEHFDVAATLEDRVNLGASPGDDDHPLPYLYVGPWEHQDGPFWNEPFGASLTYDDVAGPTAAVAFFRQGLALL
jgi:hypothetical protein